MIIDVRGLIYEKQAVVSSCVEQVIQEPTDDRFTSLRNALFELTRATRKTLTTHSFKHVNEVAFRKEEQPLFALIHKGCDLLSASNAKNKAVASFCRAMCYKHGLGVEPDRKKSVALLRSAERHYPKAQFYLTRHFSQRNKLLATKRCIRAAEAGLPSALLHQAICCGKGSGVPRNDEEMIRFLRLAAEKNSNKAIYNLALCYKTGRGVPQNEEEALRLFCLALQLQFDGWGLQKALFRGSFYFLNAISSVFDDIDHVEEDFSELLNRAVAQRFTPAQVALSIISLLTQDNVNNSCKLLLFDAAVQGMPEAKVLLLEMLECQLFSQNNVIFFQEGECHQVLDWVRPFVEKQNASHILQKRFLDVYKKIARKEEEKREYIYFLQLFAEEHKNPEAQEALGGVYLNGAGVLQDVRQGIFWLQEAQRTSCVSGYSQSLVSMKAKAICFWSWCRIL